MNTIKRRMWADRLKAAIGNGTEGEFIDQVMELDDRLRRVSRAAIVMKSRLDHANRKIQRAEDQEREREREETELAEVRSQEATVERALALADEVDGELMGCTEGVRRA